MSNTLDWGSYNYLSDEIEQAQAATVRITRSTAVMISERFAVTAAHSPLDENNEITPDLTVQNLWGEVRNIVNVYYDIDADFAIVELETPFDNSYAVKLADAPGQPGDQAFIVGHPWTVANSGVGWAVAFGTAYPHDVNSTDPGWSSFDIDVQGGFSGSGIYNEAGELLAILSASYLEGGEIESPYFKHGLQFQNEFWDIRNGHWASGPGLDYIKAFMAAEGVENTPAYAESLPANEPDPLKERYLSDEELEIAVNLSSVDRLSNVLVSDVGAEEKTAYQFAGGGSGTLIHDSLILTVGHALDARPELSIGAYNGQIDSKAKFWALSKFGDLGLIKADPILTNLLPEQEIAARDVQPGEGAYHIGSPRQFWFSEGGWWSVGARALGDGIYSSVSSGGMSGGGIYDLSSNIVGVTSTGFGAPSGARAELTDRQDPHQTEYNPTLSDADSRVGTTDFFYLKQFVSEYSPSSIVADSSDWFAASAIQIGTSIFEIGWRTDLGASNTIYLKRYNELGVLDPNFGSSGIRNIELGDGSFTPTKLLEFSDYFYVVGTHNFNQFDSLFVARLDREGILDTSFGQDGIVSILHNSSQRANAAVVGNDGSVYVAGTRQSAETNEAFVFKLVDGIADPTFGDDGYAMNPDALSTDIASDLGLNDDGDVFLLTTTDQSGGWDYGLTAFDSAGQVNTSFGDNGQVLADYENEFETANKLLVVDDGIILSGFSWVGADENPLLFKYAFDGSLDSSFGDDGVLYINIDNGGNNFLTDMRTEGDELSLLLSGTRRIQANEAWGDVIEGSYTIKTLNISSTGEVIPASGQSLNLMGNEVNYAVGFVDGSDGKILRQTPSQNGFTTDLLLATDLGFSEIINLSGFYSIGDTPSTFEGSELDDVIESHNSDPVTLFGLDGDDLLAAWGVDEQGKGSTLYGGPGDDRLYGTPGADQLYGGVGFDHFSGQAGDDFYHVDNAFEGAELHGGQGFDVAFIPGSLSDYHIWGTPTSNYLLSKSDPSLMIQCYDMERFVFDDTEILTSQIESFIDLPQIASWEIKLHDYLDVLVLTELSSDLLITAGTAHNYIFVGPGNDHIDTGLGDDRIFAGDGNDTLIGGFGSDVLNGAGGDDVLNAGNGDDWVDAGDGDDLIIGGSGLGDDYYSGGDGVDTIKYTSATAGIRVNLSDGAASSKKLGEGAGIGKDILESIENVIAGNFDDELVDDSSDNRFEGLTGNDRFELSLGKNYIDGGEGNDTIIIDGNGTFGLDLFAHNISSNLQTGTNEFLNLNGKTRFEDVLYGGADVDTVELTDASDAFFLHDTFSGFHSSLSLSNDHEGRSGTARIKNIETINAGEGDDIVDLTSSDYSLAGQIITVDGGEGNDTLWGSDADETLKGGNGDDELFGGAGLNELIGGAGADEFQFSKTSTNDTVADFNVSDGDTLKFFNTGGAEFDRESIALNSAGDELYIAYGSGVDDALTISLLNAGLQLDDLTSDVLIIV